MALDSGKGFILLEILLGLVIISIGLSVILGFIQTAATGRVQAHNLLEAMNAAVSGNEEVTNKIKKNRSEVYAYLDNGLSDRVGIYHRTIKARWDSNDLLLLSVQVEWIELGERKNYCVESLLYLRE